MEVGVAHLPRCRFRRIAWARGSLFEPLPPVGVTNEILRQHFDRNLPTQPQDPHAKHLAHDAGTDAGDDFVMREV
jgi:hypothetical protein